MKKKYDIKSAINEIYSESTKKRNFTESFEVVVNLFLGEKDEVLRGSFELPNKMKKTKKIAIFAEPGTDKFEAAKNSGADFVGMDDLMNDILAKKINYDVYLTSSSMMPKLKKIASKLGPRNKMPNNKLGTLVENPDLIVDKMKNQISFFKSIKGSVQTSIGDISMTKEEIEENTNFVIKNLVDQFKNLYPTKDAIKSIYVKTTMGKSFLINEKTI